MVVNTAIGYFQGDFAPQVAVPDAYLYNDSFEEDEEPRENQPWERLASGQFNTEYRRQIEEALALNTDVNKVRRKLEKLREMNENIQEGTHDPTISKEGSSQQQYEQWLTMNEARLQKIRMTSYVKRNPHLADLSEETLLLRQTSDTTQAKKAQEEENDVPPVDVVATTLSEMSNCHREVLELLQDVPLDPEDEAVHARRLGITNSPDEAKDQAHQDLLVNDAIPAESDSEPEACAIRVEDGKTMDEGLRSLEAIASELQWDGVECETSQNVGESINDFGESSNAVSESTIAVGESSNDVGETEVAVAEVVVPPPSGRKQKARAAPSERLNEWDREVYGVDDFDDTILDDFEVSMGSLLDDEFASMRAQISFSTKPKILQENKEGTGTNAHVELSELD